MFPTRLTTRSAVSGCVRACTILRHLRQASKKSGGSSFWTMDDVYKIATNQTRSLQNMEEFHNQEVILLTKEKMGIVILNRPKALNALNLNMIRMLHPVLKEWDEDPNIGLILIKGSGEKAFCAGGDVRAIAEAGQKGENLTKEFFKEEYSLNHTIGTLKTPYVAFIHGITMGGGVGLSVHGKFRVATEKTVFAMPETAIGFFPDVGGGYFLPRLRDHLGSYLALTGCRLKGIHVKHAGVATHFVKSDKLLELEGRLLHVTEPDINKVKAVLDGMERQSTEEVKGPFLLEEHMEQINRCFSKPTVEEIVAALKDEGSEWSLKQVETLGKMSPTSMKVTLKQIEEGGKLSFADCFKMEYRLCQRFMEDKDFYEGIRAVLVDKDNNPQWGPGSLEEVSQGKVNSYFEPLGERDLLL